MKTILFLFAFFYSFQISFGQNKVDSECTIWKPSSYCEIPKHLNLFYNIKGEDCYWNFSDCEKINKKNLTGVHIEYSSKTDTSFNLTSKFRNICLQKKNTGKIIHPEAILWSETDYDHETGKSSTFISYMTNHFRVKKYEITYRLNTTYDLVLLFKEAETGDKIIIDNFLETLIK